MDSITIKALTYYDDRAFSLFLLADPCLKKINNYIQKSTVYSAYIMDIMVGTYALLPVDEQIIEIKNIAVCERLQRRGIGTALLQHAQKTAASLGYKQLITGTANSSIYQLLFYQKSGFEVAGLRKNFYLDNYEQPILENGIQAKHMIVLSSCL